MGGICGIVNWNGKSIDETVLRRMMEAQRHRGADHTETGLVSLSDVSAGFGNGLLVVDPTTDHGSAIFPDGRNVWTSLDGEIYGLDDLWKRVVPGRPLPATEHEALSALYEAKGLDLFRELNGAFSMGLWDRMNARLVLARDRVGVKPLYYLSKDGEFVFSSELKALLCHPKVERTLSLRALSKYLAYEYVPTPDAIIEGVHKLPAASFLVLEKGDIRIRSYHQFRFSTRPRESCDEASLVEELRRLLTQAVRRRLGGPSVPGFFLSGGIDSSTLVAFASRLVDPSKIKTFSIGFHEKSFDESSFAQTIASKFGTDHHLEVLDHQRSLEVIPEVFRHLDEPFADASIIPTSLVCRLARKEARVVIGGDGADEFFRGYPTFLAHQLALLAGWLPKQAFDMMRAGASLLPVSMANLSVDFKIKQFLKGLAYPPGPRNQVWLGSFDPEEQKELFTQSAYEQIKNLDLYEDIARYERDVADQRFIDRIGYIYIRTYLPDDGFVKTDRASMPVSLALRTPMLDNDLLDFINSLPPQYKSRGTRTKIILKKALEGILPEEILSRGKKGFGMPVAFWLRNELKGLMLDLLSPEKIKREVIFRPQKVQALMQDHLSGKKDNRKPLWALICYELWRQNYLPG
ncbi:MAG: asparagine synthase (glutamine-hydrolyzing) [Deltaproteobacteria bacterium]|nr:asparagine synthase (glutamine-hydrolyzing) [Deltaproteobacteria bacterium]